MTWKKFFIFFFLQWIILAFAKVWLFGGQVFDNVGYQYILFYVITAVVSIALIRRFGPISYAEAFIVLVVWILVGLFLDLIITSSYTGLSIFSNYNYWGGFVVLFCGSIIFHKKRHLHLLKELRAKKHAEAHHAHAGDAHGHDEKKH